MQRQWPDLQPANDAEHACSATRRDAMPSEQTDIARSWGPMTCGSVAACCRLGLQWLRTVARNKLVSHSPVMSSRSTSTTPYTTPTLGPPPPKPHPPSSRSVKDTAVPLSLPTPGMTPGGGDVRRGQCKGVAGGGGALTALTQEQQRCRASTLRVLPHNAILSTAPLSPWLETRPN